MIRVRGLIGFIDGRGDVVVSPRYQGAHGVFWEQRCLVKTKGGKCGYIGMRGTLVIPAVYDSGMRFNEGLAFVRMGERWGVVDRSGRTVIGFRFKRVPGHCYFEHGLAPVAAADGKFGYINRKGEWVIEPRFDFARSFSEHRAAVRIGKDWGYIDTQGFLLPGGARFGMAGPFREGLAAVRMGGRVGYLKKSGDFAIEPRYCDGRDFSNGLAKVRLRPLGKMHYIRRDGTLAFEHGYDSCGDFNEGVTWVETDAGYGYINTQGAMVIKPRFGWASSFHNGLAAVGGPSDMDPEYLAYIDTRGQYVWGPCRQSTDGVQKENPPDRQW
jgi:hypothetical protein